MIKNKKYIFIWISLFILTIIIGFGYYKTFAKKEEENVSEEKETIVYLCIAYDEKFYSDYKKRGNCHRIGFECKNCEILPDYIDNQILYSQDKKLYLYDLIKKENILTLNFSGSAQLYTENGNPYGIEYWEKKNEEKYFYNLRNNKKIDFIEKNGTVEYICDDCYLDSSQKDKVISDLAIMRNSSECSGLLNLKTDKCELENVNYHNIYYNYQGEKYTKQGYYNVGKDGNIKLLDEKLNTIFENKNQNDNIKNSIDEIDFFDNGKFFIKFMNSEYIYGILDEKGNVFDNSIITVEDLASKIYDKIESSELKKTLSKTDLIFELQTSIRKDYKQFVDDFDKENKYYYRFYYNKEKNIGYIYFFYSDTYTETYINLNYKYDFDTKTMSEYDVEYAPY